MFPLRVARAAEPVRAAFGERTTRRPSARRDTRDNPAGTRRQEPSMRNESTRNLTPTTSSPPADLHRAAPKPWHQSLGVWGSLLGMAGSVAALFKAQLDPALLAELRDWVLSLVTLIGAGAALWGRLR